MSFGLLDDNFCDHPKVVAAGNEAIGVWVRCLSYVRKHRTRGYVPRGYVEQIAGGARRADAIAKRLVDCALEPNGSGLWIAADGGWSFHDYEKLYRSKQADEALSKARSDAGKKGAAAKWGDRKSDGNLPSVGQATEGQTVQQTPKPKMAAGPSPSPDPSPEDPEGGVKSARARVDRKRLRAAYAFDWGLSEMAIETMALEEMCKRVEGWAAQHGRDATETALASLPIMAEIAKRWTRPRPPLPHLVVRNWGDVEAVLAGKIAAARWSMACAAAAPRPPVVDVMADARRRNEKAAPAPAEVLAELEKLGR